MATNTCTSCGCKKCGCADNALISPAPCPTPAGCPDPIACSEYFDAECIVYSGADIECIDQVVVATNTNLADALNDLITFFCEFITEPDLGSVVEVCDTNDYLTLTSVTNPSTGVTTYTVCFDPTQLPVVELASGTGINVTSSTVGNTTTYTVNASAKEFFYDDNVQTINLNTVATPSVYSFPNVNYSALTYTNPSLVAKTYKVWVSYNTITQPLSVNSSNIANWVDGAIIKTVAAIDTIMYQSLGQTFLSGSLMDGPNAGDVVNRSSIAPDQVLTTAGNTVEFRFLTGQIPSNVSFFYYITLNPGETVSLKFKTKDATSPAWLTQAQMMVEEI
jgi:hypothetical protein